jgi:hypothetical protein
MRVLQSRLGAGAALGIAAGLLMLAGCAGGSPSSVATTPSQVPVATGQNPSSRSGATYEMQALLHPAHKYFGISLGGVPQSVTTPITQIQQETGKRPNLVMYYEDWGTAAQALAGVVNFNATAAENACAAGMLPMLTWESWDTTQTPPGQGVPFTQPAFDMKNIIAGQFDTYIRKTAEAIAAVGCPIALRFDQEENGFWYPWGISNTQQNGTDVTATASEYIAMWRHVETIFRSVHATNVLWVWSPNVQSKTSTGLPKLRDSYPGRNWVNWVGIDGYYNAPSQTFTGLMGPVMKQLSGFAAGKPWIIAETGVGDSTPTTKAAQIKNLLTAVATSKQLDGLVYFEQHRATDRANWLFTTSPQALQAFKAGIDKPVYASGQLGNAWYLP